MKIHDMPGYGPKDNPYDPEPECPICGGSMADSMRMSSPNGAILVCADCGSIEMDRRYNEAREKEWPDE